MSNKWLFCVPGQCTCFQGYIGGDCSISEGVAPSITSLEANGLCSLQNGGCTTVLVSGGPFAEEVSPKCHYQETEVKVGTRLNKMFVNALTCRSRSKIKVK